VLEHTAVAVESCPPVPVLRWAALLHDLGKPDCFTIDENGTGHFYGHGNISHIHAENILKRLKVSNDDYNTITKLVKYHDNYIETNEKAVRRALNRYGEDFLRLLLVLKRADNAGQNIQLFNRKEEYDTLEELINNVIEKQQCFSLKQLAVNGDDLSAIGIPPSKETGMILNRLLEMVINGDIPNERAILLSEAATIHIQNNVL
jgi:tRNA nucleotidyltransferase (CCA-adding enzyme)